MEHHLKLLTDLYKYFWEQKYKPITDKRIYVWIKHQLKHNG